MTLTALRGHSPTASLLHLCFHFSIYFYCQCHMYVWYVPLNKHLLTYFMVVLGRLYSHCVGGTSSQCIGSEVVPPLDPKLLVQQKKPPWSWRIFIKQIRNSNISKNKCNSLWSFSPTSELRIISWRHVNCRQVLSTVDRRPSPVDHTQRPAFTTTTGYDACVARGSFVSGKTCSNLYPAPSTDEGHC